MNTYTLRRSTATGACAWFIKPRPFITISFLMTELGIFAIQQYCPGEICTYLSSLHGLGTGVPLLVGFFIFWLVVLKLLVRIGKRKYQRQRCMFASLQTSCDCEWEGKHELSYRAFLRYVWYGLPAFVLRILLIVILIVGAFTLLELKP